MEKVKVAIIGYGHLGKWHTQKAQACEKSELIAIVEVNDQRHAEIKESYPNIKIVCDLSEIINEIDAGVIVTPTSFHSSIVLELLNANKHVFCEKPLCSNLDEANQISELAKSKKELVLQVGHSERFHQVWENFRDDFLKMKDGMIQMTRISSFKGRATDVDVVQDLMIHDIDLLYYLFGSEVEAINGQGIKSLSQHWDHVNTLMNLSRGNKAFFHMSRNSCSEERSLRVSDSQGEVYIDLMRNHFEKRNAAGELVAEGDYPKRDHLLEEHKCFYYSIINKEKAVVNLDDGVKAVKLMHKVLEGL